MIVTFASILPLSTSVCESSRRSRGGSCQLPFLNFVRRVPPAKAAATAELAGMSPGLLTLIAGRSSSPMSAAGAVLTLEVVKPAVCILLILISCIISRCSFLPSGSFSSLSFLLNRFARLISKIRIKEMTMPATYIDLQIRFLILFSVGITAGGKKYGQSQAKENQWQHQRRLTKEQTENFIEKFAKFACLIKKRQKRDHSQSQKHHDQDAPLQTLG